MTEKQIFDWCMNRGGLKRVYTWFSDNHYKITFSSGESYEYRKQEKGSSLFAVTIWIDGEMVQNALFREGWLNNGNYGAEKLIDLPIETAA